MRRKKILILPKLRDHNGDASKKWYVEFSQRDSATGKMLRKRYEEINGVSINTLNVEERYEVAKGFIESLNKKLQNGWNVFEDVSEVVYEDQLQYSNSARIYKEKLFSDKTYSYFISIYIKDNVEGLSEETVATYKSRYRVFGLWLKSQSLENNDITTIDNSVIIRFFTYLKQDMNLSVRTYRSYTQLLGAFFDYLDKKGEIVKNPIYNIPENRNYKDMGAERIHKDNLDKLMKVLDKEDPQLALACRFEYYCGLRPGYEVRLMKVGDIDFRRGYGKVRITLENAKMSRRREVTIPDVFLDYLLDVWKLDKYSSDYYVIGKYNQPGEKHLGKNNLRYRFNAFRDRLKLPYDNKFYSFKHTGAITLAEQGETTINIRDHLGHTSIATTEHYLKRHGFNDSEIIRKNFPKI
jgi:integrase